MTGIDMCWLALVGIAATALMDLWSLILKGLGMATPNYALLGRWVGHMRHGQFMHTRIASSPVIAAERSWGWALHYAIGIAFACLLVAILGPDWLRQPSWQPALALGLLTVVLPLGIMQPAMGAGFASRKTAAPLRSCARSLCNHAVFGLGLYLGAQLVALLRVQ